jgi:hypothetical protein
VQKKKLGLENNNEVRSGRENGETKTDEGDTLVHIQIDVKQFRLSLEGRARRTILLQELGGLDRVEVVAFGGRVQIGNECIAKAKNILPIVAERKHERLEEELGLLMRGLRHERREAILVRSLGHDEKTRTAARTTLCTTGSKLQNEPIEQSRRRHCGAATNQAKRRWRPKLERGTAKRLLPSSQESVNGHQKIAGQLFLRDV